MVWRTLKLNNWQVSGKDVQEAPKHSKWFRWDNQENGRRSFQVSGGADRLNHDTKFGGAKM